MGAVKSSRAIGPWFRWASVGVDCVSRLADDVGLAVTGVHPIGRRGWPARRRHTITTLRGTAVTARVGLALGVAVAVCFVTGLISHFIQHPQPWFFWPTRPVWLYRVTGPASHFRIAAIPLIIVELRSRGQSCSSVRLFVGGSGDQRLSILVLVGSMLFQLSTGLLNIAQWYAFKFSSR